MKFFYRLLSYGVLSVAPIVNSWAAGNPESSPIRGSVVDVETNEPLPGVSVVIKGTVLGTVTDREGKFLISPRQYPVTLIFSLIGFRNQEVEVFEASAEILEIQLTEGALLGEGVVITASRVEESILKSPVAIEKLDERAIRESPAPGFYDALENVKGVQMTTSSLTFKVPNTRGFNIPNNFRFVQLVDGVDMQAATLGVPLGNSIGPTELDIESVEITPGAASALYGMNAINGMANLQTKNPFIYQGLSLYQKTGINHVDGKDRDPAVLTESALRYAKAFNNQWAFKINASYMRGTDWLANNPTDQNPNSKNTANPSFPELSGANNPAYDAWSKYGDENNNAITVSGIQYGGKSQTFLVRRTGYWEGDLTNPMVENFKVDGALHYRLNEHAELSYAYRFGQMDGVFQRGNKVQLDNVTVQNHRLELKGTNYSIRSYVSSEDTGDSYNLKPATDNIQLSHLSNGAWRDKFKNSLQTEINAGTDLATALQIARETADEGRFIPGTREFQDIKNTIIKINNWDHGSIVSGAPPTGGAWLRQMSRMYHTDAQWDLSGAVKFFDLLVGADLRIYEVIPDGNNFVDFTRPVEERNQPLPDGSFGDNVYYKKYGVFAQVTKLLLDEKLKLSGSLRFDHNLEFDPKLNPRITAVYTVAENHNFRASYQNGFRFPALFEALSFVNNGNVRRVGGLPYINEGLGYLENSYTLASVNNFNAAVNAGVTAGATPQEAALANKSILIKTDLAATRPERINSFEVGYKGGLLDKSLILDMDGYMNAYNGFLGQVEVSVPTDGVVGTDEGVIDMLAANRSQQTRYRVFTNAKNTYHNYGAALGLTYNFYKTFTVSGNLNYNAISKNKDEDVFVNAFNTPNWVTNVSFGNREVTKKIGFHVVWRWQESFFWESPLANGVVPSYSTLDAQVTYHIPALKARIKAGGANIINQRYIQYAAGPNIGALYYVAVTLDGLLLK